MNVSFMVMEMDENAPLPFIMPFPFFPGQPNMQNNQQQMPGFAPQNIFNSIFNILPFGMPNFQNVAMPPGFNNMHDFMDHLFHQQQGRGAPPASGSILSRLPKIVITQNHVKENLECSVCKDTFALNDNALQLPCSHLYHVDCIEPWLKQHCTCPVCRYELPTEDEEYEKGRKQRMATRNVNEDFVKSSPPPDDKATTVVDDEEDEADRLAREFLANEHLCSMETITNNKCTLLEKDVELNSLECGHVYHKECLESALRVSGEIKGEHIAATDSFFCPLCRQKTCLIRDIV